MGADKEEKYNEPIDQSKFEEIKEQLFGKAPALIRGQREQLFRQNYPVMIKSYPHNIRHAQSEERELERVANQIINLYQEKDKILAYCDRMIEHNKESMHYERIKELVEEQLRK